MSIHIAEILDRPIAFQRPFVSVCGSITAALFLSQCVYWSKRSSSGDGWFYKTQADWEEETGMTRAEQEGARKKLKAIEVLCEVKKGVPCTTYYKVDFERLSMLILQYAENKQTVMRKTSDPVCGKQAGCDAENQQSITENTQRIHRDHTETTDLPAQQEIKKPSKTKKSKSSEVTFSQWRENLKDRGEVAIPDDDNIFDYPKSVSMDDSFLDVAWQVFTQRYAESDKKYTDWRAVFRNAVRNNWLKLWWFNQQAGCFELTVSGHQARLEIENGRKLRAVQ